MTRLHVTLLKTKGCSTLPSSVMPSVPSDRGDATLPAGGNLQELIELLSGNAARPPGLNQTLLRPVIRVRPHSSLLHEGTHSRTMYVVRSGSFKCVRTLEDGYEQVLAIAQAGELLGHESLHGGPRRFSAIALEFSTVYALTASDLHAPFGQGLALDEALTCGLSRQLARVAETVDMMAAVSSDARLARFILWLAARQAETGQSARRFLLRMSRREIASLLGLAHETVSRSFTTLSDLGFLHVDNREVEIADVEGLKRRARTTRGGGQEETLCPWPLPVVASLNNLRPRQT